MVGMAHVVVSRLAYAHPGGDLLFSDVSFRTSPGEHVGVVGSNGVGKSTLCRVLTGALPADEGEVSVGGIVGYMAQDVGAGDDSRSVRELLLSLAPLAMRLAGERVLRYEAQLAAGNDEAGMQLGTAIADWSALGG
jgi:ATPase subunit of ABC transporter with duplicated ATPase domains